MYYYEKAVELEPTMHAAARNLALLYETQGFKRKAMEMWNALYFPHRTKKLVNQSNNIW